MAKKLIRVWLFSLTIVLFSSISVFAEDSYAEYSARGDFFIKNVVINGERIVNYNLQYSIILYNDVMYIPFTPEMREIYGLQVEMDWESHTLRLRVVDPTRANISENWLKNDARPLFLNVIPDVTVVAHASSETREVYMGELPLLQIDGHFYLPLRALSNNDLVNWDIYYNTHFGITISTNGNIPASTFFDHREALKNRGLLRYIMRHNPRITPTYGTQYVFLFRRAGEVFDISPLMLMALAHRESTFNNGAIGRGGSAGLMQVMPATGARHGLTPQQLLDPKTSIDFGAMYLRQRLDAFDNDIVLALSAYNQGSGAVSRGNFTTTFAERVIATYQAVHYFLEVYGYVYPRLAYEAYSPYETYSPY